jgi:hypothetical protein
VIDVVRARAVFEVLDEKSVRVSESGSPTGGGRKWRGDDLGTRGQAVSDGVVEVREDHRYRGLVGLFGAVDQGPVPWIMERGREARS